MATTESPAPNRHLRPFEEQEPFLRDGRKYYGYVSGVGAGKTYAGAIRTALNMERWNPGEMGAIVAPTTTMIKDVIVPLLRDMGLLDHWEYKSAHTDEPGIHSPNGARALILSADNRRTIERLAGLNLAWFWMDEAARIDHRAYEILTQRIRVGKYRNGFVTTTPMGRNWVYDTFAGDVDGDLDQHGAADVYTADDRLAILRVPTFANPHTPEDFKEQVERDHDGQVYEQEVMGEFVEFEGLVYRWFSEDLVTEVDPDDASEFDEFIYGVDWGFDNPSVILAIGIRGDEFVVCEEFYESRLTETDLVEHATAMQERWGPGRFYCDPAEPSSIATFQRAGLNAQQANNSVTPGIRTVTNHQDRLLVADSCQAVRNEFRQYQYAEDGQTDEPLKKNDHAMDALRYALHTHDQTGGEVTKSKHSLGGIT